MLVPCGPTSIAQETQAVKSAVETLNPTRVKFTVEVPFDELKPSLDAAYKSIANQVSVPGFRKGKVPPRIIDQRIGRGAVIEEAVHEALPRFYAQALHESEVKPLGQPTVDITQVPDAPGSGLTFTAEVDVRPEITLPELEGIAVTVDDVVVDEEDVNQQVETLRERFGTLVPVDKAAGDGDFLSVDLTAMLHGDEIDSVKGISYQVGSGSMLPGTDEAVTGLCAGETTTFTAPLAGGDHAGQDAVVTITVQAVKERSLPELDDDFASLASEFDTLEELVSDVREQVRQRKAFEQGLQARERLLDHLLATVEVPLPDGVIEAEVHQHLESESRLDDDEHRAEVTEQARSGLASRLLLDAVVDQLKVSVGQQEFIEYLIATSQQYGMEPNAFARTVEEAGQVPGMVGEVARRKALAVVLEQAQITDASGNPINLDEIFPAPGVEGEQELQQGWQEYEEDDEVLPEGGPVVHHLAPDDPSAVSIPMLNLPVIDAPPLRGPEES